jgi:DNA polymerase
MYGEPMEILSGMLRGCIVPSEGKKFYCGDYASIEVRVLFWLSDHKSGLKAYLEGRDLYREMAAVIYGVPLDKVTKEQREVGKRAILGAGYGLGAKRFAETCKTYGMEVSDELAERAVKAYRKIHYPVVRLWHNYERAAVMAIENPGKAYTINKCRFFVKGKFLFAQLPSGRRLAYYGARIDVVPSFYGPRKRLSHMGVNPKTRQWARESTWGGKLTENIDSACARDNMAGAMFALENAGYEIVLTVHDEILAEHASGDVKQFEKLMAIEHSWTNGLPVKVDAWTGPRYRK